MVDNNYIVNRLIDILNSQNQNLLIGNISSPRPGSICNVSTKYGIKRAYNINCTYPGEAIVVWDKDEQQYYCFTNKPSTVLSSRKLIYRKNREIVVKKVKSAIAILFRVKDYTKSSSPVVLGSDYGLGAHLFYTNFGDPFQIGMMPPPSTPVIEDDFVYEGAYSIAGLGFPNSAGSTVFSDLDTLDCLVIKDYVTVEGYSSPNYINKVFEVTGISMVSSATNPVFPYTTTIAEPYQTIYSNRYLIPQLTQVGASGSIKVYRSKWYVYYNEKLYLIKLNNIDYINDNITDYYLTTLNDKAILNLWNRYTNTLYNIKITDKVEITKYVTPQVIYTIDADWQKNWAYNYIPAMSTVCSNKYKTRLANLHNGILNKLNIPDNFTAEQIRDYLKITFSSFLKENIDLSYYTFKYTETSTCNLSNQETKTIKVKKVSNTFTDMNEIEVLDVSIY